MYVCKLFISTKTPVRSGFCLSYVCNALDCIGITNCAAGTEKWVLYLVLWLSQLMPLQPPGNCGHIHGSHIKMCFDGTKHKRACTSDIFVHLYYLLTLFIALLGIFILINSSHKTIYFTEMLGI